MSTESEVSSTALSEAKKAMSLIDENANVSEEMLFSLWQGIASRLLSGDSFTRPVTERWSTDLPRALEMAQWFYGEGGDSPPCREWEPQGKA